MSQVSYRYRLYDLIVESEQPLSLMPVGDEVGADGDERWCYEEGPVEEPSGRIVHDVADFDGRRRLKVYIHEERGILFSHGQTRVEWDVKERRIVLERGEDLDVRPGIVLERMVAPIALIIRREKFAALHASAVGDEAGNAWIFIGDSGAGKSTTALELLRGGMEILADDLVMIDGESGEMIAATPSVRLFDRPGEVPEAVDEELVMPEIEKYWYQLPNRQNVDQFRTVRGIFALAPRKEMDAPRIEELKGREATVAVIAQGFDLTEADGSWREDRFRTLCRLAREIPVYRVIYGRGDRSAPQQIDAIADHFRREGIS